MAQIYEFDYIDKGCGRRRKRSKARGAGASVAKTFRDLFNDFYDDNLDSEHESEPDDIPVFKAQFKIAKTNDEKKQFFGWALVSHVWGVDDNGNKILKQVVDYQKDMIDEEELEEMAYGFVLKYREGGSDHQRGGQASCIESTVFTLQKQQALGIPAGTMPVGWWIGFQVTDDALWDGIKKGKYKDFSIEGQAVRTPVTIDEDSGEFSIAKGGGENK